MKRFLPLLFCLFFFEYSQAQCVLLPNAVPDLTLVHQNTNCFNNSGVAYNPLLNLYYGVRAGNSGFPLETWSATGTPLYQTSAGFDWRGMWWNPVTNQLEGNGYNTFGVWNASLNGSGYALNTGTAIFTGYNQPDPQSCGDLDPSAYEILYYFNGSVYRYSRNTNAFLGSYALTGTPTALSNLNWTTLMYTGCPGKEIALLDYVNKVVYVYDKSTGAYAGSSALPASAITTNSFRTSWANCKVWLFNLNNYTWYSYRIFDQCSSCSAVFTNINHSMCPGDSVLAGGAWQTTAGTYYDTLTSTSNCDSIIATTVAITPVILTNINHSMCAGDSLFVAGAWQHTAGVYPDSLQSSGGCDSVVNHTLSVIQPTTTTINHTLCYGDSILIAGTWHHVSGTYTDSLTSAASGCDSIVQHNVVVLPQINTSTTVTICSGDSLLVGGAWQHTAGTYTNTYTAQNGCDSLRITNLVVAAPAMISQVKTICQGDSLFLAGAWQHLPGMYNDTLTTAAGCDSILSTVLLVNASLVFSLGPDTALCEGQSMTLNPGISGANYQWQNNSTNPTFTVTSSGTYWVEINAGACKGRDTIQVTVNPVPVFTLGPDKSLCPGETITLDAYIPNAAYDWFNHDHGSSFQVSNAGTYWVDVSLKDCSVSDTIHIDFNNPNCACRVDVPNAFSPNKDKLNDEFGIINEKGVELLDFKIYNRFGQLVFKAAGVYDAWDGNYELEPAEIGTYYYLIKYRCTYTGKEYLMKGDVTLVR